MAQSRRWTDEDQQIAEELRAAGWSQAAIGTAMGLSPSAISRRLDPAGMEKDRECSARRRRENPEKAREKEARWHRDNPKKAREKWRRRNVLKRAARRQALSPLTLAQKEERYALFGNHCAYCGAGGKMTPDHVLALHPSRGGHDEALNIVPACRRCNSSKGARPVEAWYRSQPFFTEARWAKIWKHCPNSSRGQLILGWDPSTQT